MNILKSTLIFKILLATLIFGFFTNIVSPVVRASTEWGTQFVTQNTLQDENGNRKDEFGQYDNMQAVWDMTIPDSAKITSGDTMTISIPEQLYVSGNVAFAIKDPNGNLIGNAQINKTTNQMVITFTNYYEQHNLNRKFSVKIWTVWDQDQINTSTNNTLDWGTSTSTIYIEPDGKPHEDELLSKWGSVDKEDPTLIHWTARVNYAQQDIQNGVITDQVGPNQKIVDGSITALLGTYDNGETWAELDKVDASKVIIDSDTQFHINIGNFSDAVLINYDTRATDNGRSDVYTNSIRLTGDSIEEQVVEINTPNTGGDGNGTGDETDEPDDNDSSSSTSDTSKSSSSSPSSSASDRTDTSDSSKISTSSTSADVNDVKSDVSQSKSSVDSAKTKIWGILPRTGESATWTFTGIGALLLVIVGWFIFRRRK